MRLVRIVIALLAVATLFATISCKGKIGGPNVPKEPGEYLDFSGRWEAIDNLPQVTGGSLLFTQFSSEEIARAGYSKMTRDRVRYAMRMTPSQRQLKSLMALGISAVCIYPLKSVDRTIWGDCKGGCYLPEGKGVTASVDKSDFEVGYLYFEFTDLPPSSTELYCFKDGDQFILFKR
ncbi:MAG: hypothetical protein V1807_00285 [Patescibacteria group bacterium]